MGKNGRRRVMAGVTAACVSYDKYFMDFSCDRQFFFLYIGDEMVTFCYSNK